MKGLEFQAARQALGLSTTEMAQELQVARETIWRWETEHVQVSRVVELALEALQCKQTVKQRLAEYDVYTEENKS